MPRVRDGRDLMMNDLTVGDNVIYTTMLHENLRYPRTRGILLVGVIKHVIPTRYSPLYHIISRIHPNGITVNGQSLYYISPEKAMTYTERMIQAKESRNAE